MITGANATFGDPFLRTIDATFNPDNPIIFVSQGKFIVEECI